jgi:hypothetical protein
MDVCGQLLAPAVLPVGKGLLRTESLMDTRAYLNTVAKRKISAPLGIEPRLFGFHSLA